MNGVANFVKPFQRPRQLSISIVPSAHTLKRLSVRFEMKMLRAMLIRIQAARAIVLAQWAPAMSLLDKIEIVCVRSQRCIPSTDCETENKYSLSQQL